MTSWVSPQENPKIPVGFHESLIRDSQSLIQVLC